MTENNNNNNNNNQNKIDYQGILQYDFTRGYPTIEEFREDFPYKDDKDFIEYIQSKDTSTVAMRKHGCETRGELIAFLRYRYELREFIRGRVPIRRKYNLGGSEYNLNSPYRRDKEFLEYIRSRDTSSRAVKQYGFETREELIDFLYKRYNRKKELKKMFEDGLMVNGSIEYNEYAAITHMDEVEQKNSYADYKEEVDNEYKARKDKHVLKNDLFKKFYYCGEVDYGNCRDMNIRQWEKVYGRYYYDERRRRTNEEKYKQQLERLRQEEEQEEQEYIQQLEQEEQSQQQELKDEEAFLKKQLALDMNARLSEEDKKEFVELYNKVVAVTDDLSLLETPEEVELLTFVAAKAMDPSSRPLILSEIITSKGFAKIREERFKK